ncbi:ribosomal-protein-alanine N-acetyltransferase [Haladaptatus litoreus]|uniref:Ribosomal-protein-alanine N-acetyltransferase n=1 Tax=Haladaptatus litoreus TaxID=553468 RepID=A0A1N7B6Q2_9EURY|nr:GNAT family N-acetyltransferase [Haladaptatus litoreus]SIR46927.1 ribosomal-protein-alanine N-acetyltransferase [Haladaptatus litoreus]
MIRKATSDDLSRLRQVREWLPEPTPQLLETALSGIGTVFVSTAEGRPVGYVLLMASDDAYLPELVVEPSHRREGRATRLVETAIEAAENRGCDHVSLTVHEENESARTLYESVGFELWREESAYYADGGTALVLKKSC